VPVPGKDPIVAIANSLYSSDEASAKPEAAAAPAVAAAAAAGKGALEGGEGSAELEELTLVDTPQAWQPPPMMSRSL
jgi:hypothetical protein